MPHQAWSAEAFHAKAVNIGRDCSCVFSPAESFNEMIQCPRRWWRNTLRSLLSGTYPPSLWENKEEGSTLCWESVQACINPILGHTGLWDPAGVGPYRHQGINTGSAKKVISANMRGRHLYRICPRILHTLISWNIFTLESFGLSGDVLREWAEREWAVVIGQGGRRTK